MRISDWSSDVCSSDLAATESRDRSTHRRGPRRFRGRKVRSSRRAWSSCLYDRDGRRFHSAQSSPRMCSGVQPSASIALCGALDRSEEHTSELQSLMRISYAVFCLKKKKQLKNEHSHTHTLSLQQ